LKQRRDLYLVAASLLTWGAGEGLFYIFQPLYLQGLGADPVLIGTILGVNGFGMALAQVPAGYLSDRIGRRPLMWFAWIMGVVAAVIMASAQGLTAFVIGLVLYGLTSAALAPMNSYVAQARGDWSVGRALSFTSAAYNVGATLGPLTGGLIAERFGLRSVYIVASGFFVISTLILLFIRKQSIENTDAHEKSPGLLKNPRFVLSLGMILVIMFALYLPQPLTSNFLQNERGLSLAAIGRLGSVQNIGNVIFLLVLGHLPPMTAFMLGQVSLMGFSALLWKGSGMFSYGLGYLLLGGYRLARSLSSAFVRPVVGDAQVGLAFGFVEAANNLAYLAAPVLAGLIYDQNPKSVYPLSLIILWVSLCLTFVVNRHRSAIKNHFSEDTSAVVE
jgi:MFS family permease